MFLLKSMIGIAGHDAARQRRVCGVSRGKGRPRPPLLEGRENRLCFSMWSEPVSLGPMVNSSSNEGATLLSPDGLSLYVTSDRPGGFGGSGNFDFWVSRRQPDRPSGPGTEPGANHQLPRQLYRRSELLA